MGTLSAKEVFQVENMLIQYVQSTAEILEKSSYLVKAKDSVPVLMCIRRIPSYNPVFLSLDHKLVLCNIIVEKTVCVCWQRC